MYKYFRQRKPALFCLETDGHFHRAGAEFESRKRDGGTGSCENRF